MARAKKEGKKKRNLKNLAKNEKRIQQNAEILRRLSAELK